MYVQMMLEFLVPGMKHAKEAEVSTEMGAVASHFEKSFCAGPEQQPIDDFLVLEC